jgi:hypothetical protein
MRKFYKFKGNVDINSDIGLELFERDLNMILNSEIWCSSLEDLNDPFEGEYKMDLFKKQLNITTNSLSFFGLKKKSNESNAKIIAALKNMYELSKKSGIYSLTTNFENDLMWSHYANSHKGFCIEYEFDTLKTFDIQTNQNGFRHLGKIEYSNDIFDTKDVFIKNINLVNFLFRKNIKWHYENEWRILSIIPGKYNYDQKCIKSIIFGLKTSETVIDLIIHKLTPLNIDFYKIKMKDSYMLEKERIYQ